MALDPVVAAFQNLQPADAAGPATWGPTGAASPEDVNRFRAALGEQEEGSRPVDRMMEMLTNWNDGVVDKVDVLGAKLKNFDNLSVQEMLHMQIQSHAISLAQSLMAKAGAVVNETSNALLRGQ